jgi:hypothetical protein
VTEQVYLLHFDRCVLSGGAFQYQQLVVRCAMRRRRSVVVRTYTETNRPAGLDRMAINGLGSTTSM